MDKSSYAQRQMVKFAEGLHPAVNVKGHIVIVNGKTSIVVFVFVFIMCEEESVVWRVLNQFYVTKIRN